MQIALDHEREHASPRAAVMSGSARIGFAAQTLHARVAKAGVDASFVPDGLMQGFHARRAARSGGAGMPVRQVRKAEGSGP